MSYRRVMQEKTRELLVQLRANPEDFYNHVKLFQGRLIMSLTFGYDLKDGDNFVEASNQLASITRQLAVPVRGALVNLLPFLRHIPSWVPYFSYKPLVQRGRKMSERMKNGPIEFVKNALHNGTAVRSLASEHLQELEDLVGSPRQEQEEIVVAALGSLYRGKALSSSISTWVLQGPSAGLETVRASQIFLQISYRLLQLRPYLDKFPFSSPSPLPAGAKAAQAELDVVVGRDRLPTFDDRQHLPYIEAICKELMRWLIVAPIGISHSLRKDDVYKGFFIPKGASMIANAWAILHDPEAYPEPDKFKPERFLNEDGTVRDDPMLSLVFGIGRRICPGRHLVESTVFIVTSSILSVFNVTKAKDENGNEIPVKVAMVPNRGTVIHPDKFECSILPRDKVAEDLISSNALSSS
ncbi:cytochrome P450 [Russula aff. rugulosa BPL654]|nr:cytochrome P450 [Russula aff. rugulosa BPL654]